MGQKTGIAWTRSSWNPWIGCTEVSPGCDACYARELDKRHRYGGATHWGAGVERYVTALDTWLKPERWNALAEKEKASGKIEDRSNWHTPGFWPVFPSMCDPFDNEIDDGLRSAFWALVWDNPNLTWLLLTKRIGNASKMLPWAYPETAWPNVWIGASVVNREEAKRDLPKLRATPARRRFVSFEPGIEEIDWTGELEGIDQVIVGGESRQGLHKPRPFVIGWARSTMRACRSAGVAFFMKQFGSNVTNREGERHPFKDRSGSDPAEWPEDLRVQEFPA